MFSIGGGTAKCQYQDTWIYNDETSAANMTNDVVLVSTAGGTSNTSTTHFVGTAGDVLKLSLQVHAHMYHS
jgi:hypothetical protein